MIRKRLSTLCLLLSFRFFNAQADDWGCQVQLCLSDPRGPTTEKECIPPMEKLWSHLARGGNFPICHWAGPSQTILTETEQ